MRWKIPTTKNPSRSGFFRFLSEIKYFFLLSPLLFPSPRFSFSYQRASPPIPLPPLVGGRTYVLLHSLCRFTSSFLSHLRGGKKVFSRFPFRASVGLRNFPLKNLIERFSSSSFCLCLCFTHLRSLKHCKKMFSIIAGRGGFFRFTLFFQLLAAWFNGAESYDSNLIMWRTRANG